jgi:hypothetical protein
MAKAKLNEVAPQGDKIPRYQTERVQLPHQVIPDKKHITILDVGQEGAVVGLALAALINYLTSMRDGSPFQASPRMLYEMARRYDGIGSTDHIGTHLWAALYGWQKHGVTTDKLWPYVSGKRDDRLTKDRERAASPFKPQSYERVPKDVQVVKAAIIERGAVFAGATAHDGWHRPEQGIIPYSPKVFGGTAINLLGYTTEGFIIQNSWGEKWGNLVLDGQSYSGMAIWSYSDFETNFQDGYVARLWPSQQAAERRPFNVRAGYLADLSSGDHDFLNIMPDVRAISAVLAARDVRPPLALGLFGNWGTGKSFFMDRMKKEINRLSTMKGSDAKNTPYCQKIVQIEFNAWHFLDTNLWASLVSEIFDRLHERIRPPAAPLEETRSRLVKELGDAEGLYRQSQLELKEAQEDLHIAETGLVISQIAQAVGAEKFASTSVELSDQLRELKRSRVRVRRLVIMLKKKEGLWQRLGLLAIFLVGAGAVGWLATWLGRTYPDAFSQLAGWVNTSWRYVVGALAWLAAQWRSVGQFLSQLEEKSNLAFQLTDNQKKHLADSLEKEKNQKGDINDSVRLAEKNLTIAQNRVAQVQRELAALSPRWQMQQYIVERSTSQDYRSQLGLISLIRRDFEKLSNLLDASAREGPPPLGEESTSIKQLELPFERIILYIDDLDRCTPKRVVEVLEAVHLLLAFPIFVVVVAVDPRWLRTCLEISYPELLSIQAEENEETLDQPATPQDYMEKIFQIPFYLRPLDRYGYSNMIRGLVEPEVDPQSRLTVMPQGGSLDPITAVAGEKPLGPDSGQPPRNPEPGESIGEIGGSDSEPAEVGTEEAEQKAAEPINPDLLKFKSWEMDDLQHLSPLFRTPRAVKRFINTYRLVKVGIDSHEIHNFEGGRSAPGTSRIAQALLAVVAGYPNQAQRFLQRLLAQVDSEKPVTTWIDFLTTCKEQPDFELSGTQPNSQSTSSNRSRKKPLPRPRGPVDPGEREWLQMCDALLSVSKDGFLQEEIEPYIEMVKRVARFSFSVSDLPTLRKRSK